MFPSNEEPVLSRPGLMVLCSILNDIGGVAASLIGGRGWFMACIFVPKSSRSSRERMLKDGPRDMSMDGSV